MSIKSIFLKSEFTGSEDGFMRRAISALSVCVLAIAMLPTVRTMADYLANVSQSVLRREPQLKPAELGDGTLAGLQFANPTEQLVLMDPPEANYQGGAELEHPLLIPPGRGSFQPKLTLTYDSAG